MTLLSLVLNLAWRVDNWIQSNIDSTKWYEVDQSSKTFFTISTTLPAMYCLLMIDLEILGVISFQSKINWQKWVCFFFNSQFRQFSHVSFPNKYILREEIFAEIKFREFREISLNSRNLFFLKNLIFQFREIKFLPKFEFFKFANLNSGKKNFRENFVFFDSQN